MSGLWSLWKGLTRTGPALIVLAGMVVGGALMALLLMAVWSAGEIVSRW